MLCCAHVPGPSVAFSDGFLVVFVLTSALLVCLVPEPCTRLLGALGGQMVALVVLSTAFEVLPSMLCCAHVPGPSVAFSDGFLVVFVLLSALLVCLVPEPCTRLLGALGGQMVALVVLSTAFEVLPSMPRCTLVPGPSVAFSDGFLVVFVLTSALLVCLVPEPFLPSMPRCTLVP